MKSLQYTLIAALFSFSFVACQSEKSPKLTEVTCQIIPIDSTYDAAIDPALQSELNTYKLQLDSAMNRVIGSTDVDLYKGKPQSLLSNFTADILLRAGKEYTGEKMDIALVNDGGLRAPISKGEITVGDIFKVFPFENELVTLRLTGADVKTLFKRIAAIGGEGLGGVELVVRNNEVESLRIDGKPVKDDQEYWLATIDYLADGNSGMSVLLNAKERKNPGIRLRDVMLKYVEQLHTEGKKIQPTLDNRIKVNP